MYSQEPEQTDQQRVMPPVASTVAFALNTVELFNSFSEPNTPSTAIQTTYSHDETDDFVTVTYSFQGPEASIGTERRSIELSPHFQSACPPQ